jgi:hypothetical protein
MSNSTPNWTMFSSHCTYVHFIAALPHTAGMIKPSKKPKKKLDTGEKYDIH